MEIHRDSSRQAYIEVHNVRVTVRKPSKEQDWAGTGRYVGFRAYRDGEGGGGLNMGADLPIRSKASDEAVLNAVGSLLSLLNEA